MAFVTTAITVVSLGLTDATAESGASSYAPPLNMAFTERHYLVALSNGSYALHTSSIVPPTDGLVVVTVDRNPAAQGWDYLQFTPNRTLLETGDLDEAYYAVGYAEGLVTTDSIYSGYVTAMNPWIRSSSTPLYELLASTPCGPEFMDDHVKFMRALAANSTNVYARQVGALLRQIDGLADGYAQGLVAGDWSGMSDPPRPLQWHEIFFISFQNEMGDVINKCAAQQANQTKVELRGDRWSNLRSLLRETYRFTDARSMDRCSALVKVTPDDIFMGHATWNGFNSMVRQYKIYAMQTTVAMSSYPGSIASGDDWYLTFPTNLTITETTNDVYPEWLSTLVTPQSVSEFIRAMVASYLATSAVEWVQLFSEFNSGTYNNQYMVLDHNLARNAYLDRANATEAVPALPANTFWVLEQTPGLIESADMTWHLNEHSYWPSYNIPYFKRIYDRSGYPAVAQRVGSIKNYSTYARAVLFAQLQTTVADLETMFAVMRHNNYMVDAASEIQWCTNGSYACSFNRSSVLSIAARGDLAPPDWVDEGPSDVSNYVDQQFLGAIDAKITSMKTMMQVPWAGFAVMGPTTSHGLPPLNLTQLVASNTSYYAGLLATCRGLPTYFDFAFVRFGAADAHTATTAASDLSDHTAVAAGVAGAVALLGFLFIFTGRKYCFTSNKHNDEYRSMLSDGDTLSTVH